MTDNNKYNPQAIEPKWQQKWEADKLYRAVVDWNKPKHYALTMLPYPSGDLHIGHWFAMTPSDARARYMRMKGCNVLFPMGFDAFGLPAENAAVQRNIHPKTWTYANIERMRKQLRSMGAMFDWEREAVSCDPEYYKWTEWFFKQFFENGLAYRGEALVNWSPTLQTVLANEQVIDGKDERTGQPVIQKMMTQWFFRYTKYADEMLDFSHIDWPEPVRVMQTNWIGRSEGARVVFHTEQEDPIEIYTTRPDTLWGATFMVLSPEHPLVDKVTTPEQRAAVEAYKEKAARETEIERTAEDREKTGVFTGGYAINPVNAERIPIWIADYVLMTYGTGAIMAVPAHDQRDFEFARKYDLPIRIVIQKVVHPAFRASPQQLEKMSFEEWYTLDANTMTEAWPHEGIMVNSGPFDGTPASNEKGRKNPAISAVIDWLEERGIGKQAVNYRLRDWLISRQRYWGSPIPVIHKADGTIESVPDDQLPVLLPDDVDFLPTGQSPLLFHEGFLNTTAPDGTPARRETDTMDTFMCSSWYWYRYLSPHYDKGPFDPEEAAYWLPVDTYTGGAEHATMHLLYARWFAKAMRDLGMFDETMRIMKEHGRDPESLTWGEPMMQLRNQGQVLGEERPGDELEIEPDVQQQGDILEIDPRSVVTARDSSNPRDPVVVIAKHIKVRLPDDKSKPGQNTIVGELMRRSEYALGVRVRQSDGTDRIIPVSAKKATVEIPGIPGEARVDQLKHHLEVQRMSKTRGNVVNPDEWVGKYGADTVRAYLMFGFDWQKGGPWDSKGIQGVVRWLNDVWDLVTGYEPPKHGDAQAERNIERRTHQTIKKVTDSLENFSFNTGIAGLMSLRNDLRAATRENKIGADAWRETVKHMLLLMSPFTPHIAEELWAQQEHPYSIHQRSWPAYDAEKAAEEMVTLVVQVNGKVRDRLQVPADISEDDAKKLALESDGVRRILNGGQPKKVIYVAPRGGQEPKINVVV